MVVQRSQFPDYVDVSRPMYLDADQCGYICVHKVSLILSVHGQHDRCSDVLTWNGGAS